MRILFFLVGLAFLSSCGQEAEKELMTASGNKYIHHIKTGGPTPQVGEEVTFAIDFRNEKEVVQSTRTQPEHAKFVIPPLEQLKGNTSPIIEGIMLMAMGDSLTLMISTDSFPEKPKGFENSPYINYDIVIKEIKSADIIKEELEAANAKKEIVKVREEKVGNDTRELAVQYKAGKLNDKIQKTASGLKYIIHEAGTGIQAEAGKQASVHYYGMLTDGKGFDNSFKRGDLFSFKVGQGQVIRGWDEGVPLLKEGGSATLFIPYELAYGEAGRPPSIPAKSELIFYVELDKVQ